MKRRKRRSKKENNDINEKPKKNNDSPKETMEKTDKIARHISKTKYTGMGK